MEIDAGIIGDCGQFICFFDTGETGNEERDRTPIAIGATRQEAFANGCGRALEIAGNIGAAAIPYTSICTVAQPNLTADEFALIGKLCDEFFSKAEQ